MNHIVDTCPLTKFEDVLNLLHEVHDDAVIRLESTVTAALANNNREAAFFHTSTDSTTTV